MLQLVGQVANRHDTGHARAALERVQVSLQRGQRRQVVGLIDPAPQRMAGAVEDIHRLFDKDGDDFIVLRVVLLGIQLRRGGAQFCDVQGLVAFTADQAGSVRRQAFMQQRL